MRPETAFDLGFELEAIPASTVPEGTITSVAGVEVGTASVGLRGRGGDDLALIYAEGATAAGVFTSNRAKAAPVVLSMETLAESESVCAIVANAGCANALTGERGMEDAVAMQQAAASKLGVPRNSVLVASTGLIGTYLPRESVVSAIGMVGLSNSVEAGHRAARAIMTTDTHPKECAVRVGLEGYECTVGGIAKGAAMLAPSMATMLAFLATDAALDRPTLARLLANSVEKSFNKLSVDACMSTNDTVVAFATGRAETSSGRDAIDGDVVEALQKAFDYVCAYLALEMARDAEGSSRIAVVRVKGAASSADAEAAAMKIAASSLVRCSLYGGDPYWGRVLSEAGSAARVFDPSAVSVAYGPHLVCSGGVATEVWGSEELSRYMSAPEIEITCDLGVGAYEALRVMASLGPEYVEENMKTS